MTDDEPGTHPDTPPDTDKRQRPDLKALLSPQQIVAALKDHVRSPSRDVQEAMLKQTLCGLLSASDTEDACQAVIARLDALSPNLVLDILIYHGAQKLGNLELPREIPQPVIATVESLTAAVHKVVEATLAAQATRLERLRTDPRSPEEILRAWLGEEASSSIIKLIQETEGIKIQILNDGSFQKMPVKLVIETRTELITVTRTDVRRVKKPQRTEEVLERDVNPSSIDIPEIYKYAIVAERGIRHGWAMLSTTPITELPNRNCDIVRLDKKLKLANAQPGKAPAKGKAQPEETPRQTYEISSYRGLPLIHYKNELPDQDDLLEAYIAITQS